MYYFLFLFCISVVRPHGRACFWFSEHKPALCYNVSIIICTLLFHFSIFTFSISSLIILCEKSITRKLSAAVNPCNYHVLVIYCIYIPLNNYIFFHREIITFAVCLLSLFIYLILCLRVIIYLYYFPLSHNIYTDISPVKSIVMQTTYVQKKRQDKHTNKPTNTYRDKQTVTDIFRLIHIVLHKLS